ncbi:hypothetical protein H0I76_15145 [Limibaculum sp. M0105]|uniref:LPS-assembly lipoprotein n=1 Tax=Thermohalobaculum xanthum TaxID=2753746 RepID=A0A8J7SIU1_9RHOB|nr:LPS assembly lipoprotein LptE [Thermohalobaculum xanthum]MBK0400535.1 hypothetical protein [Thermohalobaculum xanthum]
MSSCDRRRFLALCGALAVLPGCFRPMLAEGSGASELRGRIALPQTNDRLSYFLHDTLESRLGTPNNPDYRLEVATALTESGLLVEQDNTITRIRVQAVADFRLYYKDAAEPVLRDRIVTESGYDATASLYASRTTEQDIERRLAKDLGERIARRIQAQASQIEAAAQS